MEYMHELMHVLMDLVVCMRMLAWACVHAHVCMCVYVHEHVCDRASFSCGKARGPLHDTCLYPVPCTPPRHLPVPAAGEEMKPSTWVKSEGEGEVGR